MRTLEIFSAAMSRVGESLSDLEEIASRLSAEPGHRQIAGETNFEPSLDAFDNGRPLPADEADDDFMEVRLCPDERPIVVGKRVGTYLGSPVFDTKPYYTKSRNFSLDDDGYLVDEQGLVLMGRSADDEEHAPRSSVLRLDAVRLPYPEALPPRATGRIGYRGNLPKTPMTALAIDGPASTLLNTSGFSCNPTASGNGSVIGYDVARFLDQSLAGGTLTVIDHSGAPVSAIFRWAKIDCARTGQRDVWNLFYRVQADAERGMVAWRNVGADFVFGSVGRLAGPVECRISAVKIDGRRIGDIKLDFDCSTLTQFEDASGLVKVIGIDQDGYIGGTLTSVSILRNGDIVAAYGNGQSVIVARAVFADASRAPSALRVAA